MKIFSPEITGSTGILGSLEVSGGITGSLKGTATSASYATQALSASYAPPAATPTLQQVTDAGQSTTDYLEVTGGSGTNWMTNVQNLLFDGSSNPVGHIVYNAGGVSGVEYQIEGLGGTPLAVDPNLLGLRIQNIPFDINAGTSTNAAIIYDGGTAKWGVPASASYATTAGTAASATTATSASFALTASYFAGTVTSASYALTASYALNGGGGAGEATVESGNILFENIYGEIYGSAASPVTGNITVSGVSTKVDGAVAIIYHTAASEPTISGATVNKKVGIYESGSLNIITLTNIDGTNILEYIAGGSVVNVPSASYAANAGVVPAAGVDSMKSANFLTTTAASAAGTYGIALGNNASALGYANVAIGTNLLTGTETGSVAIGLYATSSGFNSVAVGTSVVASGYQSVAMGSLAQAPDFASTAVGGYAKAEATLAVAVGNGSSIRSYEGVGIGASTEAEGGTGAIAIGKSAKAWGPYTIALGYGTATGYGITDQIAIGRGATTSAANEIAIGSGSLGAGANTITLGNPSHTATYLKGTVYGNGAGLTNIASASYAATASVVVNNNTASGSLGFWQGSQTEYNAISGSASNSIIYFII